MRLTFVLICLLIIGLGTNLTAAPIPSDRLNGDWFGELNVPGGVLHIQLIVKEEAGGALSANLVSIDQGGTVIPVTTVVAANDSLHLTVTALSGSYHGKLVGAGDAAEIQGNWSQGGPPLPLTFKRTGKPPEPKRPQTPTEPYPYKEESVSYKNVSAGATLAATLTIPNGKGPFPAVLLITGSGSEDRNETVAGHKPFLVIADYLTRRGIAVLRADDRGVGGSTGDPTVSTKDLAGDVVAGMAFLKSRSEIDPKQIGLVGHSDGANIGSIAATESKDVAFLVMLGGMGLVGEQVLYLQGWRMLETQGAAKSVVDQNKALQEGLYAAVKTEADKPALTNRIREVAKTAGREMSEAEINATAETIGSPWFRYFLTFDPAPVLKQVHCPVLALYGEKDTQVTPKENAPAVEAALKGAGNKDVTVRVLPGLNHLFQTSQTGSVNEYNQIEETFAPAALTQIGDWIAAHTQKKS